MIDEVQYLLNEISHFHLRPLLGHVSLHLRVCVIDDGQEHVLHRQRKCILVLVRGIRQQCDQTSTQHL